MNDQAGEALIQLIRRHGTDLIDDPRRLEGMLRDVGGDCRREIFVIMNSLKARVAEEMLALPSGTSVDILAARLERRLIEDMALADDAAAWVVSVWAEAILGKRVCIPASPPMTQTTPSPIDEKPLSQAKIDKPNRTPDLVIPMISVPGAAKFPTKTDDSGSCSTVNYAYEMGKTPVTYDQWKRIYDWAMRNGYHFANPGSRGGYKLEKSFGRSHYKSYDTGHDDHPVTCVSWWDAVVWCNALTDYSNRVLKTDYFYVYKIDSRVIRDARTPVLCDSLSADPKGNGYRLPTSMEWELAARYIDGNRWTSGFYASGAGDAQLKDINAVAWYKLNSDKSTHPVGEKTPNALGIYDMNGNVWEWCYDGSSQYSGAHRVNRGGSWDYYAAFMMVGLLNTNAASEAYSSLGFRVVRMPERKPIDVEVGDQP